MKVASDGVRLPRKRRMVCQKILCMPICSLHPSFVQILPNTVLSTRALQTGVAKRVNGGHEILDFGFLEITMILGEK